MVSYSNQITCPSDDQFDQLVSNGLSKRLCDHCSRMTLKNGTAISTGSSARLGTKELSGQFLSFSSVNVDDGVHQKLWGEEQTSVKYPFSEVVIT